MPCGVRVRVRVLAYSVQCEKQGSFCNQIEKFRFVLPYKLQLWLFLIPFFNLQQTSQS